MKRILMAAGILMVWQCGPQVMMSQVTIGGNIEPHSYSVLELISNGNKGLRLPQLTTAQRDMITNDPNFTGEAKTLANGLTIYNTDTGCQEFWNGDEWKSLCGSVGKADFTIPDCSQIMVNGAYYNGKSLGSDCYLTIPVQVNTIGTYTINVVPSPANGYYFTASGEFLSKGTVEIVVRGQGTPLNYTPPENNGDEVVITVNGVELDCANKPFIKIGDTTVRPKFGISCQSVTVNGVYKKNTPLTQSNKITLRINVQTGSLGAGWTAETEEIDGIRFKGSGILGNAGSQEITLYGEGSLSTTSSKTFTISTNSESGSATCHAVVVPVIAKKKIIEFAYNRGATYGLASGGNYGPQALIDDNMNFGDNPNSIVKYEGFSTIEHLAAIPAAAALRNYTTGANAYDIIIITYNETPDADQRITLTDYVNHGGILIYLDQNITANNTQMVGSIFGEAITTPVAIANTCNQVIKMNPAINDEISNGPFGDVRDSQWGEDYANSCGLPSVPRSAIVYAGATNASTGVASSLGAKATMLRHPTKNFFWCGDSGMIHGDNGTSNTTTPFKVGSITLNGITYPKYPIDKPNYGSQAAINRLPVCNSIIFANVMAWALKMAEENGINSGK